MPDSAGNLVIRNLTGQRLVLFRGGEERLKVIPDDLTDYVVAIANPSGDVVDLRIFRLNDLEDVDSPTSDVLLKRWAIPLAQDFELEHRSKKARAKFDHPYLSGCTGGEGYPSVQYISVHQF